MTEHNFELSDEQNMILDTLRKLVQEEAEPKALEADEHGQFVRGNFDQLAEMGMLGVALSEESGGADLGWLSFVVGLEEMASACGSTARLWLSHAGLCGKALEGLAAASATCEAIAGGASLATFVGPEFGITATAGGDGHQLSGTASLVTAATEADVFVVAATDADGGALLFCVPADAVKREPVSALGFRASAPGIVSFDGVSVGGDALVASGDEATAALERSALAAGIGAGAIAVGMARASYECSRRHVHERIAFGKPLFAQQAVRHKLVDSLRKTEAARHMVYHAARLADAGQDASQVAMLAKLEAVEAAVLSADEGIQVHGGYGYVVEYHVERHYRDAKSLEIMDRGAEYLLDRVAGQIQL